jgi:hypothetical protein
MAEDLLDYWVRLITSIFPANAWITSRFSNNDHLIQIDWKLDGDSKDPNKRSRKIEIIIKERVIEHYLDKNKKDRELSDILLKEFIYRRYNHFVSDNDTSTNQYVSTEKWLVSRDVLNGGPSSDTLPRNQVKSVYS